MKELLLIVVYEVIFILFLFSVFNNGRDKGYMQGYNEAIKEINNRYKYIEEDDKETESK